MHKFFLNFLLYFWFYLELGIYFQQVIKKFFQIGLCSFAIHKIPPPPPFPFSTLLRLPKQNTTGWVASTTEISFSQL